MSVKPIWDNPEHTILRLIYAGDWTVEEYFAIYDQARTMIAEGNCPIVLIIDMTRSGNPPPHFFSLVNFIRRNEPEQVIQLLMLGRNSPVKAVLDALIRLMPEARQRIRFVDSLDEAHQIAQAKLDAAAVDLLSG